VKVQHMPPVPNMIWRTQMNKPTRGGAASTVFDYAEVKDAPPTSRYGAYTEESVWRNVEYFRRGTIPTAERAGVKICFHPDDPRSLLFKASPGY